MLANLFGLERITPHQHAIDCFSSWNSFSSFQTGFVKSLLLFFIQVSLNVGIFFLFQFPVLVDKDQNPKWNPSTLEEVSDQSIDECFSSLGEKDLTL